MSGIKINDELEEQDPAIEISIRRGLEYLASEGQDGFYPSYISDTREVEGTILVPRQVFSSVVIADTLPKNISTTNELRVKALNYVKSRIPSSGLLSFFEDGRYPPPDADTNSLAASVLLKNGLIEFEIANNMLNAILSYRDQKGRVQVWLSDNMPADLDELVAANALYLGYQLNRGQEMKETEDWIIEVLDTYRYIPDGTHYYPSPDAFLYFLARLMDFPEMRERLHARLVDHVKQRFGTTEYSIDLAMRTILAASLEIPNEEERQKILKTQKVDGSWPTDALFGEGRKVVLYGLYYGNKSLPSAFSVRALESTRF